MKITHSMLHDYLSYCEKQKRLDSKTLKAYRIDLEQFYQYAENRELSHALLNSYIRTLHERFRPNSAKRKIASLHAYFHYEYRCDVLSQNPMDKIETSFRQCRQLPRTIPLRQLEMMYRLLYEQKALGGSPYAQLCIHRDIAVLELLLGTGLRISELCHIEINNINFHEQYIRVLGKGNKERVLQIGNDALLQALLQYQQLRKKIDTNHPYFFINKFHERLSEQSVRNRIKQLCSQIHIDDNITPHMFRHTFATLLLEEDIDIRYIQHILGHSSITTTQIYTHIRSVKQADILNNKNPRNFIRLDHKQ